MLRCLDFRLPLGGIAALLLLGLVSERASAITPFEVRKIVGQAARPSAADQKAIDDFLKRDFFRYFMSPNTTGMLPGLRKDYGNIVRGIGKTPAHDFLTAKTFEYSKYIIGSKAPLAGKYNAMLLIADLNESDVPGQVKPYPPAMALMLQCLNIPADSPHAYLKVAALIGVTRLAEENAIPPSNAAKVYQSLVAILKQPDPPSGRSASAHNYMRRGAARALAALGSPGNDNEVLKAMEAIVADPNARISLRCEVAQYIGQLKYPDGASVDFKSLANVIGHMTVEVCQHELDRATEQEDEPSRRILMYALNSGNIGLGGLAKSAEKNAEASKFISGVRNKIYSLHQALDNTDKTPDNALFDTVAPEIDSIQDMLLAKPNPPAPMVAGGAPQR